MKHFRLFAAAVMVALCVTSCSDDDKGDNGDLSTISVGTWEITAWESYEGDSEEMIGLQFVFKKDGFADVFGETNRAKWSVRKKGDTFTYNKESITLKDDALVLAYLEEEIEEEDDDPVVFLIKERTSNTMQVSVLDFEMENDPEIYSRGTWKKIK